MIAYELSDPRVSDAVVTEVLVSPDRKRAQVRLHLSDDPKRQRETIAALDGARHFLRRQLAERLNLFRVPELHFESDVTLATNVRLEHLMKLVRRGTPPRWTLQPKSRLNSN